MKQTKKKAGGKYQRNSAKPYIYILLICLAIVILTGSLVLGYLHLDRHLNSETIMGHVFVAGVDVGGMTKAQAVKAVRHATAGTYTQKSMVVQISDQRISLNPGLTGASLNAEQAIELAFQYGRSNSMLENAKQHLKTLTGPVYVDILPCLKLNRSAIHAELQALAAHFSTTLTQPSYKVQGSEGEDQILIFSIGTRGYDLVFDNLYQAVLDAYNQNTFHVDYPCSYTEPDPLDLDLIYNETYSEAVDAAIDPKTYQATAHIFGYAFDLEQAKALLAKTQYGQTFSVPYLCTVPEITQEELDALLFRDLLASYTAKASSSTNRDTNLRLACEAVHNLIIGPGETFDYNKALGERTAEKGYRYAASYYGNQTINTIGGGICQVSSTLYYCALMSDLEITSRINHGFLNTYVPMGMDATVSWGGPEFRFRNDLQYPIRIEAHASGGEVTIKLWGTDTRDYYVKMDYTVLYTKNYQVIEQEMPENNSKGYRDGDVIITPYTGYKVVTYRCKYDKQTNKLLSKVKEAESVYNKRDLVICKIVPEETIPPSQETTPPTEASAPPTEETMPPPEETTPPTEETTPPTEETAPPAEETTPTTEETTTPAEETTPSTEGSSPVTGGPVTEDS